MPQSVRHPIVSNQFYPGEKRELNSMLDNFLDAARPVEHAGKIRMVIVPHAGYVYSGPIAAYAYRQLRGEKFDRVILVGPSHSSNFDAPIIDRERVWRTPLGGIRIDDDGVDRLVAAEKRIQVQHQMFDAEHALEVQLPFLQKVLPETDFIPIMMGEQSFEMCESLANALSKAFVKDEVLIIASSDLYHGNSYKECVAVDQHTVRLVESFDVRGLSDALDRGKAQACGGGPIVAGLLAARQLGGKKVTILKYANSNDITGSRGGYVVGYVSAMVLNFTAGETTIEES